MESLINLMTPIQLWAGDPWDIWLRPASDIVNEQASEEQIQKSLRA